jgi:O-antigen/teichoic acid export membrane protein
VTLGRRAGHALFWNGVGLVAAKAISLVRFFVLARLLEPVDFGLLAIAWTAIELLLVVSNPGMGTALIQRRRVEERDFNTVWTAGLLRTLLVGVVVFAAAGPIAAAYGDPRAAPVLRALALAPLLSAAASAKLAELNRRLAFRRLTVVRLAETGTEAIVSIALAAVLGVWALVVGVLVSNLVRILTSYVVAPHRPALMLHRASVRSLFRFGRWVFLSGALFMAGDALLRAAVSQRLGTSELGVFYLSLRLVLLPITSIEGAVSTVGMRAHVELGDDAGRRARALQTSLVGLLALLAPAYAVLIVLASGVVSVLGPQWASAVDPIRVTSLAALLTAIGVVCEPVLLAMDRPHLVAIVAGCRALLLCVGGWVLAGYWGLTGAAIAYLTAESIVGVATLALTLPLVARPLSGLAAQLGCLFAATAVAAGAALGVDRLLGGPAGLILSGVVAMLLAVLVLAVLDRLFSTGVTDVFHKLFPQLAARLVPGRPAS